MVIRIQWNRLNEGTGLATDTALQPVCDDIQTEMK